MRRVNIYVGLSALAILLLALAYVWMRKSVQFQDQFLDGFFGNLFASLFAVVVGVPIALKIENKRREKQEEIEYAEERKREREVLLLLKEELEFNRDTLLPLRTANPSAYPADPLKTSMWDTVRSTEMLKSVEDPRLLNRVASAYYVILRVDQLERLAYSQRFNGPHYSAGADPGKPTLVDARKSDALFKDSVDEALKMVDTRIKALV